MPNKSRGVTLTIFAMLFLVMAISNFGKPFSHQAGVGFVFLGTRLSGVPNMIIAPIFRDHPRRVCVQNPGDAQISAAARDLLRRLRDHQSDPVPREEISSPQTDSRDTSGRNWLT